MIRVIIIDDEYLIRQLIKNSINWESLNMEIIAEAEDGEQAIKVINELKPQIIIVDINIPFINGIEVSKIVREFYPDIKIIILTGYGEFKYAKEAISIGVLNYILKPIDAGELKKTLLNARKDIKERSVQNSYIKNIEFTKFLEEKKKFLNMLISKKNKMKSRDIEDKLKYYNLNLQDESLIVLIISVDNLKESFEVQNEIDIRNFIVLNIAGQFFSESFQSLVFNGGEDYIITIIDCSGIDMGLTKCILNDIWNKLIDFIKVHCDFTVTMAVSKSRNDFISIPVSYEEAMIAINKKFIYGNKRIIYFEDISDGLKKIDYHIFYDKNQILINLRTEDYDNIREEIKRIFTILLDERASKEFVIYISVDLISILSNFLIENNVQAPENITDKGKFIEILKSKELIYDIRNSILKLYEECFIFIHRNKKSITEKITKKARNYIEVNYSNADLSLEDIAKNIFINPCYLSKIFKKEIGSSVIEFLTELRLRKVKEILDNGQEFQLLKICESVGYNDPNYLSKCFKKHFAVTPSKYIQNKK